MSKHQYLMCPPDFFDIKYSINPWMDKGNSATNEKTEQWNSLKEKFEELNVDLEFVTPHRDWPDMVYVDVGVIYENIFIPSNFRYPERQGEREFYIKWFAEHKYEIKEISQEYYFEGHGDTLWAGDKLFFGYGFRSSIEAQYEISRVLKQMNQNIEVIPVELTDSRFYHLDTCFCPINKNQALYFPKALSSKALKLLRSNIELIEVPEDEALLFACNSVVIDKDVLIPAGTPKTCQILSNLGYKTHQIKMKEFIKGGGACKCLSLPLKE